MGIDVQNTSLTLAIYGLEGSIDSAWSAIVKIANTITKEFSFSDEILASLIVSQAALAQYLSNLYHVKIDVSRANKECKIYGEKECIDDAENAILSLKSLKFDIPIDSSIIPQIVGKGGVNLKAIESENGVIVNIYSEMSIVSILGLEDDVRVAANTLMDLINDKVVCQEMIEVDKYITKNCLISSEEKILNKYYQKQEFLF